MAATTRLNYPACAAAAIAFLLIGGRAQAADPRLSVATTIAEAVDTAERETGGMAVKGKLKRKHGRMLYEVEVIDAGAERKVFIDPATNKLVAAPEYGKNKHKDD